MEVNNSTEMFIVTLVALSIVGILCLGLLTIVALSFLKKKNEEDRVTGDKGVLKEATSLNDDPNSTHDIKNMIDKLYKENQNSTMIALYSLSLFVLVFIQDIIVENLLRGLVGVLLALILFLIGTPNIRNWIELYPYRAKLTCIISLIVLLIMYIVSYGVIIQFGRG